PGFVDRCPTVYASCRAIGVVPRREPIPVSPAAHYCCGGLLTDTFGRTGVPGLFAAGELARTGMHGANRLASNSLLEGLVVGRRAGAAASAHAAEAGPSRAAEPEPVARIALTRNHLQRAMSTNASVVRNADGLERLAEELATATPRILNSRSDFEDVALTTTAAAVAAAALARTEARGCHHRSDYPDSDPALVQRPAPEMVCS